MDKRLVGFSKSPWVSASDDVTMLIPGEKEILQQLSDHLYAKEDMEALALIKKYIKKYNILNLCDEDGNTSLNLACWQECPLSALYLISQGASFIENAKGETPLHTACYNENITVLTALLNASTGLLDAQDNEGKKPLHTACYWGSRLVVDYLLEAGAEIDFMAHNNYTPIYVACENKQEDMVNFLLEKGADSNIRVRAQTGGEVSVLQMAEHLEFSQPTLDRLAAKSTK
jgi:ankyrin repeat protein